MSNVNSIFIWEKNRKSENENEKGKKERKNKRERENKFYNIFKYYMNNLF